MELDEITGRMDAASRRRVPLSVQETRLELIASGAVGRATLAWMLGIDADSLDVDAPEIPEADGAISARLSVIVNDPGSPSDLRCHQVRQSRGWSVAQPKPGWHVRTTPAGRTCTREPAGCIA